MFIVLFLGCLIGFLACMGLAVVAGADPEGRGAAITGRAMIGAVIFALAGIGSALAFILQMVHVLARMS